MNWLLDEDKNAQVQRSSEWHEFRRKHIGASDVPAIMNECDFKKPLDLWLVKTKRKEPFAGNFATQRGIDAEPAIRKLYEELMGVPLEAPVLEFKEWPVLSASLDGLNREAEIVVEFKYPSAEKHKQAVLGKVPKTYAAQLQAQMLVTGYDTAHYVSYDGTDIAVVVVKEDKEYQARILEECKKFWNYVETDTEPPSEYIELTGADLELMAKEYISVVSTINELKEKQDELKKAILAKTEASKAKFYGLRLLRTSRKGAVDYSKVKELSGVDLEVYRKPSITVETLEVL
jgi:putative phage-type endonuclease